MLRIFYEFGFCLFSIIYLPFFFIKGKHKNGFSERFGVVPQKIKAELTGQEAIWIHAVSVGEMTQAIKFKDVLRKHYPAARFVMTCTTFTGREIAEKFKESEDIVLYYPVDFRASVNSFLKAINPKFVIILETEIWPNLLAALAKRKTPVFIINARISDRAFPKYKRIKFFLKPVLSLLTWIGAQDERMRSRFLELGVDAEKVLVTGNMKYDWAPPDLKPGEIERVEKFKNVGEIWCVAGSTHEGEEDLLFDVYKKLRSRHPSFRMLIAPRHLDRLKSIEAQAYRRDIKLRKVSAILRSEERVKDADEVLILDKMGLLANLYSIADFVFVGGSLVPTGGHNLIEPAFYEKPIVVGCFMNNFKEMGEEFKRSSAAVEVKDQVELQSVFDRLIEDHSYRQSLGGSAKRVIGLHRGATERNIQAMLRNLKA